MVETQFQYSCLVLPSLDCDLNKQNVGSHAKQGNMGKLEQFFRVIRQPRLNRKVVVGINCRPQRKANKDPLPGNQDFHNRYCPNVL